jgi:hypothetical protein
MQLAGALAGPSRGPPADNDVCSVRVRGPLSAFSRLFILSKLFKAIVACMSPMVRLVKWNAGRDQPTAMRGRFGALPHEPKRGVSRFPAGESGGGTSLPRYDR